MNSLPFCCVSLQRHLNWLAHRETIHEDWRESSHAFDQNASKRWAVDKGPTALMGLVCCCCCSLTVGRVGRSFDLNSFLAHGVHKSLTNRQHVLVSNRGLWQCLRMACAREDILLCRSKCVQSGTFMGGWHILPKVTTVCASISRSRQQRLSSLIWPLFYATVTVDNGSQWRRQCLLRARAILRYCFISIHSQFGGNFLFLPLIIEPGPVLRSSNSSLWLLLIASYVYGLFTSTGHSFFQCFTRICSPFRPMASTCMAGRHCWCHCRRDSLRRLLDDN